ncbi:MAG: DUF4249 family protein [Bacteroidetes bacterium]|nr:DUF4249 family protein [Bacteroidota bacterium]
MKKSKNNFSKTIVIAIRKFAEKQSKLSHAFHEIASVPSQRRILEFLILPLIFILSILTGCEEKSDLQFESQQSNTIVVDGMITSEVKTHSIKLTKPVTTLNTLPEAVSGAIVIINSESGTETLTEQPANSGIYKTSPDFFGEMGKNYTLLISYNGTIYSAKATMARGFLFSALKYRKNTNDNFYHIDWVANPYNAQKFTMYEILLDWSSVAGYETQNPDSCKARLLYYTLPTLDVSQVLASEMERVSFPVGTLITEKSYSLTAEHAEFVRSFLMETNWQGGLFDAAHANIATNISNGAFGFFSVCDVNTLSLIVAP